MNTSDAVDEIDSRYFIRNTRYMMMKERIVLIAPVGAGIVTVNEWQQLVFLGADGEHSVAEFISALGKEYPGGMPPGLPEQTRQLIRELAAGGYIALLAQKKLLPYYLSMPVEQQDRERAKALMETDGFIKRPAN